MSQTLLLLLAGPMQSWGFRSRFDNRDTGLEPTRSGVIGLLCAGLGWGRDADLAPFEKLRMGVRVERPGRVELDYHTAQRAWRRGFETDTVVSRRYYLADARFLVGLECDDSAWLDELETALKNPVWPLYLGRKAFAPSLPVHYRTPWQESALRAGELEVVLASEPWLALTDREFNREAAPLRLVIEVDEPDAGVAIGDVPLDFARRRYGARYLDLRTEPCSPRRDLHPLHPEHSIWKKVKS